MTGLRTFLVASATSFVVAAAVLAGRGCGAREAAGDPAPPRAAAALAATFDPAITGAFAPRPVAAGDYAMSMSFDFVTFVTTELRIHEHRAGALRLALAADGSARACAGVIADHASDGQIHYEPDPAKRRHSSSSTRHLLALAGTWKRVDGVAVIAFDRIATGTCDASKAVAGAAPELRCVGFAKSARLGTPGLACTVREPAELQDLLLPLAKAAARSRDDAPRGEHLVLGAPGLDVTFEQERVDTPTVTFHAEAKPLVERDYLAR